MFVFFFFFSSRRRHTRYIGDWSSDVCSSDLFNPIHVGHLIIANHILNQKIIERLWFVVSPQNPLKEKSYLLKDYDRLYRSEERRVGKECRSRWTTYQ